MSAARWDPNEVMNVISKSHSDDLIIDQLIEEGIEQEMVTCVCVWLQGV